MMRSGFGRTYAVGRSGRRGVQFSPVEVRHIALAIAALTVAFTSASLRVFVLGLPSPTTIGIVAGISLLAVVTGFLFHELAHKVVAQSYGCWAEFRASMQGLLFALITGFLGFVFAAPGAVYIGGAVSRQQNGKISAAGPGLNLVLGGALFGVNLGLGGLPTAPLASLVGLAAYWIGYVNVFLGGFNLIPVPPLDGSKIVRWNVPIYVGMVVAAVGLFLGYWYLL